MQISETYETDIEIDDNGFYLSADEASFSVTGEYSDGELDLSAELVSVNCGGFKITRDNAVSMTCASHIDRLEEIVADEWVDLFRTGDLRSAA